MAVHQNWQLATPKERHRPPHDIGRGEAIFLAGSTYGRKPHLGSECRRDAFQDLLFQSCGMYWVRLVAWVVLKEHYHLVLTLEQPDVFSKWLHDLHSGSTAQWNDEDGMPGRKGWYQYWDTTLWSEGDVWSRINYVHRNPVKHGYVDDALNWRWSSFSILAEQWSEPAAVDRMSRFSAPRHLPRDDF